MRSDPRSSDPAQRASPTAAPRWEHQETTTTRAREPANGGRCNLTDPRSIPTIRAAINAPRRGPEQLLSDSDIEPVTVTVVDPGEHRASCARVAGRAYGRGWRRGARRSVPIRDLHRADSGRPICAWKFAGSRVGSLAAGGSHARRRTRRTLAGRLSHCRGHGSLAGIDLRGNALAAANMEGRNANSGFGVLHGASLRGAQAGRAEEFRRQAYQRHTFVFGPNPCVFCPTPGRWHPHACRRMPNPSCCTGQTRSSRRTDGMSREASVDATGIACQRREAIGCNVSDVAS